MVGHGVKMYSASSQALLTRPVGPPTVCPLRSAIHARHAFRFTSSRGLRRTAFGTNRPSSTSGVCKGKSAPGKSKICRFVHLAHLGSRVQKRANFQPAAVEFGLPGRFRDACQGVRARKWTPLASMVECGCPVLQLGLRRIRRVAGPLDSSGAAMALIASSAGTPARSHPAQTHGKSWAVPLVVWGCERAKLGH